MVSDLMKKAIERESAKPKQSSKNVEYITNPKAKEVTTLKSSVRDKI